MCSPIPWDMQLSLPEKQLFMPGHPPELKATLNIPVTELGSILCHYHKSAVKSHVFVGLSGAGIRAAKDQHACVALAEAGRR